MVLNYNPKTSPRVGIGQIVCPKLHVEKNMPELMKRKIEKLPKFYNLLESSPRSNHLGESRLRARKAHQMGVLRNWERCANSSRDEGVARFFDMLLNEAKKEIWTDKNCENQEAATVGQEGVMEDEEQGEQDDNPNTQHGLSGRNTQQDGMLEKENTVPQTGQVLSWKRAGNEPAKARARTRPVTGPHPPERRNRESTTIPR